MGIIKDFINGAKHIAYDIKHISNTLSYILSNVVAIKTQQSKYIEELCTLNKHLDKLDATNRFALLEKKRQRVNKLKAEKEET